MLYNLLLQADSAKFVIGYLTIINLVSFLLMGIDKLKAKSESWRISESIFYLLSLLQGYPGILMGAIIFHHKTGKILFQLINLVVFIIGMFLVALILSLF